MLRRLNNHKAQAHVGEYVLVFFLIIGMITAMTVYVRRALQARLYDARNLIKSADCFGCAVGGGKAMPPAEMFGEIDLEYEPYYTRGVADRSIDDTEEKGLIQLNNKVGIFHKNFYTETQADMKSETLAPIFSNPSMGESPEVDWDSLEEIMTLNAEY